MSIAHEMKKFRLGDLGTFRNGVNFERGSKGTGLCLINVKDIFRDSPKIDFTSLDKVDLSASRSIDRYFVEKGDLFFVRSSVKRDGIGYVVYSDQQNHQAVHCGFVIRFRPNSQKVNPIFLTYSFRTPDNRQRIRLLSGGVAITNISQEALGTLEISVPTLRNQEKIAAILSAYDDLIENNLRRIKILEEMAQTLYREWFVKFRFPGHQKVKMVDSPLGKIPEGWEVATIDDVLATLESGSRPKGGIDPEARGVPSIGAENIIGLGRYDYSKEKFVTREFFDNMNRGHIQSGDILLYKDGAQIGRKSMFRDGFPHVECCINEHVFIFRTNGQCSQNYLFFWLDQPEMTQNIINLNANAAQPGINQSGVRGLPIFLPLAPLLEKAEEVLEPMLEALFNYAKRNNTLRQTRDLLLPRLISGELDVSEFEINTGGLNV